MQSSIVSYLSLSLAVVCEVAGTAALQKSDQFTKLGPTVTMTVLYLGSLYFLTQALKTMPLGIAYSIWGSLGIVLTTAVGYVVLKQKLDAPALLGLAMIIGGVACINLFSSAVPH